MAQLNDLIVTGNSRFINKTYTSTADVNCITASSAAGATEHGAGTTGQALISDGDSVYWGDPQHADTADEAQHATSATTLDSTEFIEDNEPYLFRTAPREAGNRVYEDAIVGASVAWNQLKADNAKSGTITPSGSATYATKALFNLIKDHVYIFRLKATYNGTTALSSVYVMVRQNPSEYASVMSPESYTTKLNSGETVDLVLIGKPGASWTNAVLGISASSILASTDTLSYDDLQYFDLTLMLGSAIADYVMSITPKSQAWDYLKSYGFFLKDYYAYNAGGIESVKTSAKKVVGFNQWDEEYTISSGNITSKNFIPIIPNCSYYIKVFYSLVNSGIWLRFYNESKNLITSVRKWSTNLASSEIPQNARYLKFDTTNGNSTTYNHDICINLSDTTKNGAYEPYQEHTYALDNNLALRGIPQLVNNKIKYDGDLYASDGTVTRRYNILNLGELTWVKNQAGQFYTNSIPFHPKAQTTNMLLSNGKYTISATGAYSPVVDGCISAQYSRIWITDSSITSGADLKTSLANVYLLVELNDPTTESAEPYINPQIVDNCGTEEFIDERDVPVPVGHESRYPKTDNYKLANIPAPPGGAGDYIVHTDEYGESVYQQAVTSVIGDGTWTSATTSDGVVTVSHVGGSGSTGAAGPTAATATLAWNTVSNVSVPYFTYDETGHISGSSAVSMGIKLPANPNTNTVSTLRGDYTYFVTGADVGVKQYSLIAKDSQGKYQSFTSGSGTASSKAINRTTYFDISKIYYYGGSKNVAVNTNMSTATINYAVASVDLRYSLNIATTTLTARKPVYLIFDKTASTVGADGSICYKVAGTSTNDWFTQTLPTSADGNIYVEIGKGVRDYRNDLTIHQTFYEYTDSLHEYDSLAALEQNERIPEILDIVITDNNGTLSCNKTFSEIYLWLDQDGHYVDDIQARLSVISTDVIEYEAKNVWYNYNNTVNMGSIYLCFDCGLVGIMQYQGVDNVQYINMANSLQMAYAEGIYTTASGSGSHTECVYTIASGSGSHAEGYYTTASGSYSHAEGTSAVASGSYSHAEGTSAVASSTAAHAEGTKTTASGESSHAEGGGTIASGEGSHAEGGGTTAYNAYTHASGFYTIANANYQTAIGKYNSTVSDALFIVGNGTGTAVGARDNAMYVTTAGNGYFSGSVSASNLITTVDYNSGVIAVSTRDATNRLPIDEIRSLPGEADGTTPRCVMYANPIGAETTTSSLWSFVVNHRGKGAMGVYDMNNTFTYTTTATSNPTTAYNSIAATLSYGNIKHRKPSLILGWNRTDGHKRIAMVNETPANNESINWTTGTSSASHVVYIEADSQGSGPAKTLYLAFILFWR